MKRSLSFLLAVVMVLSALVITASATDWKSRSEDFEKQTLGAAFNRNLNGNKWTLANASGTDTVIKGDSENQYAEVKIKGGGNVWVYPTDFAVDSFRITFDMMMPHKSVKNYYGFYFHADRWDADNKPLNDGAEVLVITQPGTAANYIKGSATAANAYDVDQWYTVEFLRIGATVEARIWERGTERPDAAIATNTIPNDVVAAPAIQLINRDTGTDETITTTDRYIYFDNFRAVAPYSTASYEAEEEIAADQWNAQTIAATNFGTGYETNFSNGFRLGTFGSEDSKTEHGVKLEEGNQYYHVNFKQQGRSTNPFGITLSAKEFSSDEYTFSGDIRWDSANASGWYGVYFVPANSPSNAVLALSRNNSVDVTDGDDQTNKVANAAARGSDWYSFTYTRIGTQVSFTLWKKGTAKPAAATLVKTVPAGAGAPTLRFVSSSEDNAVSVDNLKISSLSVVDCTAAQTTGKLDANGRYAVRFIATVNSLDYAKAGLEIIAAPATGNAKRFEATTQTVYSSILASDELGIDTAYQAIRLGGKSLIAVGIKDIPSGLGNVTFTVKPFCESADGVRTYGAEKTFTVQDGVAVNS